MHGCALILRVRGVVVDGGWVSRLGRVVDAPHPEASVEKPEQEVAMAMKKASKAKKKAPAKKKAAKKKK